MCFESRSKSGVKSYFSIPTPPICIVSIPTILQESISKLHLITEVLEVYNWLRLSHCWNFICHWLIGENMNLTCKAFSLIFSLVTVRSSPCHAVTGFWCHKWNYEFDMYSNQWPTNSLFDLLTVLRSKPQNGIQKREKRAFRATKRINRVLKLFCPWPKGLNFRQIQL